MDSVVYKEHKLETEHEEDNCCGLCSNAYELTLQIAEHFQKYHADSIDYDNIITTCNCEEIQELQELLLNHHLSRLISKSLIIEEIEDEEDIIIEEYIDVKEDEQQQQEEEEPVDEIVYIAVEAKEPNYRQCSECNAEYTSMKGLQTHYLNEHDPSNKIECPECSNRFNCERKLKTHLNNHEAEKSYRDGMYYCRLCDKPCINKARLIAHKKTHYQDYCCDYCGKKFTKFEFLEKHIVQHIFGRQRKDPNDITGKVVCPLCSKFVPKDRMKRHNFIFHSDERPFVCDVEGCGKQFKYQEPYSNHMDMHNNTPRYKCEFCEKLFYNQSNLRSHTFRHTEPNKFMCKICSGRFGSSNSLKMHIKRLHQTNDHESFECSFSGCNKKFRVKANLTNHISQVHNNHDNILRHCDHCSHTCYKMKNMQKHIARVHKIKKREHRIFPN